MSHSTQVFVKPWFKWADSFSRPQVNGELVPQFWSLWNKHVLQEKMPNILCLEPLKYKNRLTAFHCLYNLKVGLSEIVKKESYISFCSNHG